jgi:hypothetical protein
MKPPGLAVEEEEVRINGSTLRRAPTSKARGSLEVLRVSGRELTDFHPTTKIHREREKVAEKLSKWLVGTFALSVAAIVATGLVLVVWTTMTGRDIDPIVTSMVKWVTALGTLLAAPLGFVLGHYFKTGA